MWIFNFGIKFLTFFNASKKLKNDLQRDLYSLLSFLRIYLLTTVDRGFGRSTLNGGVAPLEVSITTPIEDKAKCWRHNQKRQNNHNAAFCARIAAFLTQLEWWILWVFDISAEFFDNNLTFILRNLSWIDKKMKICQRFRQELTQR